MLPRVGKAAKQCGPSPSVVQLTGPPQPHSDARYRKLNRLLSWLSKTRSPGPITFLDKADADQRTEAVTKWEAQIREAGKL